MIQVLDHDPSWTLLYEREAGRIAVALGGTLAGLHHVGSTAIPATRSKPIIDMLLEVGSLDDLDRKAPLLESMGYESMGEYGIPQRRYFRLDDAEGMRTHQVHAFQKGVPDVIRHLAFRDYMRAHPLIAEEYGTLKQRLAQAHPFDVSAYVEGKDAFVKEHERRALLWTEGGGAGVIGCAQPRRMQQPKGDGRC